MTSRPAISSARVTGSLVRDHLDSRAEGGYLYGFKHKPERADRWRFEWTIRGVEYANCNCDYGCPCQFSSPTTHGNCEGVITGHIEEGHHDDTRLDGLDWVMMFWWPGEIAEGNGREQMVIDERADDDQREGLRRDFSTERIRSRGRPTSSCTTA